MGVSRHHSIKKEAAQYLLLGIPTVVLMGYMLSMANDWLALLQNNWPWQTLAFTLGIVLGIFTFARRLRFVTIFIGILLIAALARAGISFLKPGEFDAFFVTIRFNTYFTLFLTGFLAGYGFSRSRFFSIFWSVALLALMLVIVASMSAPTARTLIMACVPALGYAAYIIYTSELIRNMNESQVGFGWFVGRRLIGFLLVAGLLITGLLWWHKAEFEAVAKEWESGGTPKEGKEQQGNLTRNDGMGTSTNTGMGLQGFNNRANKDSLVFVAKLDHFFPDGETPNPLYFTSDYYTRYDTETQTFETDTLRPFNDLFKPDPSTLPLYFTSEDTGVLSQSLSTLNRRIVNAEVYKKSLSPRHFTAPSTAFFVQPISVPESDRSLYKSAYRAKMMVSDLNSAYFVYNPAGDLGLANFQEQRFEALRSVNSYESAPEGFMEYYTQMPTGPDYDSIRMLTNAIVAEADAATPIDKILAVRDYFLAPDEEGQPSFRYSDNPGIPGIPSANKLCYFLFQNKKGYCAYYAGATLFMLRSLGIPSRIATGFLTVDRSNKNPGWYWFYEDQAHAWVQAWFPGYGWLDFDTTVPSTESQESPQPDQTPPLTSQTAWLVATGKVASVDTAARRVSMLVDKMLYWDNPTEIEPASTWQLDVSIARILRDTGQIALATLKQGDDIVAVSFSMLFKDLPQGEGEKWQSLVERFPDPVPIDEIKIIDPEQEKKSETGTGNKQKFNWAEFGILVLGILLGIGLMALLTPLLVFSWFGFRAKTATDISNKAYYSYMTSMLYLHQTGLRRKTKTPLQFAATDVDPTYQTRFADFIKVNQKLKFSNQHLSPDEKLTVQNHYPSFVQSVRKQIPLKKRIKYFLNPVATFDFFNKPNILS